MALEQIGLQFMTQLMVNNSVGYLKCPDHHSPPQLILLIRPQRFKEELNYHRVQLARLFRDRLVQTSKKFKRRGEQLVDISFGGLSQHLLYQTSWATSMSQPDLSLKKVTT